MNAEDTAFAQQYEVMIDTPAVTDTNEDIFLIRHGFSEFNKKHLVLKKDGGKDDERWTALKGNTDVIDAPLAAIGVHQALVNAPKLVDLNITRVMVSPMRRALQTAIHMFKSHPNLDKMQFIVVPHCHEIMHTSNDIPMDVYQLIKHFAHGEALCEGLKFDFSWLLHYGNPQAWSVLSLTNSAKQAQILSKLEHGFSHDDFVKVTLEAFMSCKTYETDYDIYSRG